MNKYYVYATATTIARFLIEAESSEEAYEKFQNGESDIDPDFFDSIDDVGDAYSIEKIDE